MYEGYLVVFLQDVVHLGHVFAGDGLDDISFVIGRVEPCPTAGLRVVGEGCASGQGILPRWGVGRRGWGRREENQLRLWLL